MVKDETKICDLIAHTFKLNYCLLLCFSAERHCPMDELQCNNTLCKPLAWKCDGEDDCGDNSDENPEECSTYSFPITNCTC